MDPRSSRLNPRLTCYPHVTIGPPLALRPMSSHQVPDSEDDSEFAKTRVTSWVALVAIVWALVLPFAAAANGSSPIVASLVLLLIGGAFKLGNLVLSVMWAMNHGGDYAKKVEAGSPTTSEQRLELIRSESGGFPPLGAKSCRLYAFAKFSILDKIIDLSFRNTILFTVWVAVALFIACSAESMTPATKALANILSAWLVIYSLGLLAEGIMWYLIAKDYARVWGSIKFRISVLHLDDRGKVFADVTGLATLLVFSVLSIATAIACTASIYSAAYSGLSPGSGAWHQAGRVVEATYYVLANMTTVGDNSISPANTLARAQVGLVMVMVLCI